MIKLLKLKKPTIKKEGKSFSLTNRDLLLPYMVPYLVYVFIASFLGPKVSAEIEYGIKIIVVPAVIAWAWRWYIPFKGPKNQYVSAFIGIVVGLLGCIVWVLLVKPFIDPNMGEIWNQTAFYLRVLSASLIVPVFEEMFIRGYIFRVALQWDQARKAKIKWPFEKALDQSCINNSDPGIWSLWPIFISTMAFTLGHHPNEWLAAFVYGLIIASLLIMRKDMLSCIIAHGTTNFALAFYVKLSGQYGLW